METYHGLLQPSSGNPHLLLGLVGAVALVQEVQVCLGQGCAHQQVQPEVAVSSVLWLVRVGSVE